jgi:hypothetical protein
MKKQFFVMSLLLVFALTGIGSTFGQTADGLPVLYVANQWTVWRFDPNDSTAEIVLATEDLPHIPPMELSATEQDILERLEFIEKPTLIQGGGIMAYYYQGAVTGVVFYATKAQINATGIPTGNPVLIRAESGFSLFRLSDGSFQMLGPNRNGTTFNISWQFCNSTSEGE